MKTTKSNNGGSLKRMVRPYALMVRVAGWMVTHEGIFRLKTHCDAKTGGRKSRWQTWDRVWPNN